MKRHIVILWLLAFGALSGCWRHDQVAGRYWRTDDLAQDEPRQFPESTRIHNESVIDSDPEIGICFSGGGTRSAAATLGQLRGLKQAHVLEHVRYISSVSGGTWAATPFIFLPENANDDTFLGAYLDPRQLTQHDLETNCPGSLGAALTEMRLSNWPSLIVRILVAPFGLRDNRWFSDILADRLLEPFGIDGKQATFTLDAESRAQLTQSNPQLCDHIVVAHSHRPFFIANGTIRQYNLIDWDSATYKKKRMPLEMTPLYVGVPRLFPNVFSDGAAVGGTYVAPILYGADEMTMQAPGAVAQGRVTSGIQGVDAPQMTLGDLMAISGAAPGEYGWLQYAGFPMLPTWSAENGSDHGTPALSHSDGGLCDNSGIMPLLARRIPNIIVFANAQDQGIPSYVSALFGEPGDDTYGWQGQAVFNHDDLAALQNACAACNKAHKPCVCVGHYHITRKTIAATDPFNLHLLPNEDYPVNVIWFFLDKAAWINQIREHDPKLATWLCKNPELKNFPHYDTFLNNAWTLIQPSSVQVSALVHLTSWTVATSSGTIYREFKMTDKQPDAK